jgi:opacity protein-like surface antigen
VIRALRFLPLPVAVFAVLLAGAAATPADAARLFTFGVGGGVTVPIDNAEHAFDNGVNGHGFVQLNVPFFIQPRLDFTFQKLDIKDVSVVPPEFSGGGVFAEGEQQVFSGMVQGQMTLIKAGPIQPYLIVGVGLANMETKLEGEEGTDNVSETATKTVVNGGLGVEFKLGPMKGFAEGRIDNIVNDGELVDLDSIQLVPVSFGIHF